jgi:uncharacterized Fe-S cluster-containing protein
VHPKLIFRLLEVKEFIRVRRIVNNFHFGHICDTFKGADLILENNNRRHRIMTSEFEYDEYEKPIYMIHLDSLSWHSKFAAYR